MSLSSTRTLHQWYKRFGLSPLVRYILAATLARTATGGSAVAVILLARDFGADGKLTGALAACLTLPHLLGPVYGHWLERIAQPRLLIAGFALLFTISFEIAIFGFEHQLPWLFTLALLTCGVCSSFLMGGLSTQLIALVNSEKPARRRAQSWDTITYAIGTTCGPLVLALLSAYVSIQLATSVLMVLPLLAAAVIVTFPAATRRSKGTSANVPGVRQVWHLFSASRPLKTTLLMTSSAAFSVAALPVLAVYLSENWSFSKESGAYLVTAYGVGNLLGAVQLIMRPIRTDALTLLRNVGALLLLTLLLIAISPTFYAGLLAYVLVGVVNAVFFAVTLAARSEYSPEQGAAQIYMWVAAAKIGAASIGALVAGVVVDHALVFPIFVSCAVLFVALSLCFFAPQKASDRA